MSLLHCSPCRTNLRSKYSFLLSPCFSTFTELPTFPLYLHVFRSSSTVADSLPPSLPLLQPCIDHTNNPHAPTAPPYLPSPLASTHPKTRHSSTGKYSNGELSINKSRSLTFFSHSIFSCLPIVHLWFLSFENLQGVTYFSLQMHVHPASF